MKTLYTIGHSNLSLPIFVHALQRYEIGCVGDVRSRPQSARFPHFSQPDFEMALREAGLRYVFLGDELGGRPEDPTAYRADGLVNYRVRRRARGFQAGVERVLAELAAHHVALVCAEEDPLQCHRFLMICPALKEAGVTPVHIRRDEQLETQQEAEDRLLREVHFRDVAAGSLFSNERENALEDAYMAQAERHAFRADPNSLELH